MNITSPIRTGAANAAELPHDSVSTFFRAFGAGSPDSLGVIMSALAGVAAALAVRSRCRSISAAAIAAGAIC